MVVKSITVEHQMFAYMKCLRIPRFPRIREHFMHVNSLPEDRGITIGVISLEMVRFSIRNRRWKAIEVHNPKIREFFMHTNCLRQIR